MGNLLVGVDLCSLFVEKKIGWPILFNCCVNVHLLDGLFLEAYEMKKEKEMYLDIVVGEMQDDYFFIFKGEHFVYFFIFGFSIQIYLLIFVEYERLIFWFSLFLFGVIRW